MYVLQNLKTDIQKPTSFNKKHQGEPRLRVNDIDTSMAN